MAARGASLLGVGRGLLGHCCGGGVGVGDWAAVSVVCVGLGSFRQ